MAHILERVFIGLVICCVTFASCFSCISKLATAPVKAEEKIENLDKLWSSIAIVTTEAKTDRAKKNNVGVLATAWAIDKDHLITAGHFCESATDLAALGKVKKQILLIATTSKGVTYALGYAQVIAWHNDGADDVCLLRAKNHRLQPIPIQEDLSYLETEDRVSVVGAPKGAFPYKEVGYIWKIEADSISLALPVFHGYSGSPVVHNGKLIGMVIAIYGPEELRPGLANRSDFIFKFYQDNKESEVKDGD